MPGRGRGGVPRLRVVRAPDPPLARRASRPTSRPRSGCTRSCAGPTLSTGWSLLANASTSAFATTYTGDDAVTAMFADGIPTHAGQFAPRGSVDRGVRRRVPDHRELQLRERERARRLDRRRHARARRRRAAHGHARATGDPRLLRTARPRGVRGELGRDGPRRHRQLRLRRTRAGRRRRVHVRHDQRRAASGVRRCTASACSGSPRSGTPGFALGVGRPGARRDRRRSRRGSSVSASLRCSPTRSGSSTSSAGTTRRCAPPVRSCSTRSAPRRRSSTRGDDFDMVELLPLRQATTWATDVAAEAVRFAYLASGSDGLRNPSVIGRCFRDIHAATQHVVVDDSTIVQAAARSAGHADARPLSNSSRPDTPRSSRRSASAASSARRARCPQLAEAARASGMIDNVARLVDAGRRAGVEIIHHVAMHRADMRGANHNARLFRAMARRVARSSSAARWSTSRSRSRSPTPTSSPPGCTGSGRSRAPTSTRSCATSGRRPSSSWACRRTSPYPNAVFDAVNLAYEVVVPRDAIAGVPQRLHRHDHRQLALARRHHHDDRRAVALGLSGGAPVMTDDARPVLTSSTSSCPTWTHRSTSTGASGSTCPTAARHDGIRHVDDRDAGRRGARPRQRDARARLQRGMAPAGGWEARR